MFSYLEIINFKQISKQREVLKRRINYIRVCLDAFFNFKKGLFERIRVLNENIIIIFESFRYMYLLRSHLNAIITQTLHIYVIILILRVRFLNSLLNLLLIFINNFLNIRIYTIKAIDEVFLIIIQLF